jgi:hypothetical protein
VVCTLSAMNAARAKAACASASSAASEAAWVLVGTILIAALRAIPLIH